MKLFESIVGLKAFLATVSSEVLLMRLFARNPHDMKFQSSSETDLLGTSDNDWSSSVHKKLWRRSDGRLPLDPFPQKTTVNVQRNRNVGVFENLSFQSPLLALNDLGEDIIRDICYPSTTISDPKTNGIYDEDPQWKRKQTDLDNATTEPISETESTHTTSPVVQPKMATNTTLPTAQHHICIDTPFDIKVRDFAFENHGVKSARVVSEVDVLKHRYTKERAAHQTPSMHITDDLLYFDPDWLSDAQTKSDQYFIDILTNSI